MALSQWTPESFAAEAEACLVTSKESLADLRLTSFLRHVQDRMLAATALDVMVENKKERDLEWILNDFRAWIRPVASVRCVQNGGNESWALRVAHRLVELDADTLDKLDPVIVEFWMITRGHWKARRLGDILKEFRTTRSRRVDIKPESYYWDEIEWFHFMLIPFLESAGFSASMECGHLVACKKEQ